MSNILYYSNYCENCKALLLKLNKYTNKTDTHFINIDKRTQDESGDTILTLEGGQTVIMPKTIVKVPALLLLNEGYRIIYGNEIVSFLNIETYTSNRVDTKEEVFESQQHQEPTTFEWMSTSGVSSDHFSFLDMSPDDLTATGSGGERQMYNYTNMDYNTSIKTPEENYKPDTIGNEGGSMENIQSTRDNDIKGIYGEQKRL